MSLRLTYELIIQKIASNKEKLGKLQFNLRYGTTRDVYGALPYGEVPVYDEVPGGGGGSDLPGAHGVPSHGGAPSRDGGACRDGARPCRHRRPLPVSVSLPFSLAIWRRETWLVPRLFLPPHGYVGPSRPADDDGPGGKWSWCQSRFSGPGSFSTNPDVVPLAV